MRALDTSMAAALSNGVLYPAIFVDLTFASGSYHAWTGYGPFTWNSNTYLGVGQLGGVGDIKEGITVSADGTELSLSGIDPTLYDDCMADIQIGAPASVWMAFLSQGQILGAPYASFVGQVDQPTVSPGTDNITIRIALENKMVNLQRPSLRRYTSADQRGVGGYSDDTGFFYVEILNDVANRWG